MLKSPFPNVHKSWTRNRIGRLIYELFSQLTENPMERDNTTLCLQKAGKTAKQLEATGSSFLSYFRLSCLK